MKKSMSVLFYAIQWTHGVLQNLLGAVIALFVKLRHPERKSERFRYARVFRWNQPGSMSLGMFLFLGKYGESEERYVIRHEYGHSLQSLILGPLYLPVIGLPSFLRANVPFLAKNWRSGRKDYYDFYPERWANKLGRTRELMIAETAPETDPETKI